jgi:hypothetical protein
MIRAVVQGYLAFPPCHSIIEKLYITIMNQEDWGVVPYMDIIHTCIVELNANDIITILVYMETKLLRQKEMTKKSIDLD